MKYNRPEIKGPHSVNSKACWHREACCSSIKPSTKISKLSDSLTMYKHICVYLAVKRKLVSSYKDWVSCDYNSNEFLALTPSYFLISIYVTIAQAICARKEANSLHKQLVQGRRRLAYCIEIEHIIFPTTLETTQTRSTVSHILLVMAAYTVAKAQICYQR